jgi:glycosyltransferase involved in cell wall biosynthesis
MNPGVMKDAFVQRVAGWAKNRVIRNYEEFCTCKPTRRALLSYLVLPLLPPHRFRDGVKFSNRGIAQEIPKVLNEMGYSVDIVNYDNRTWLPDRAYDLFVGHGGINFEAISRCLSEGSTRIYFATGIYWRELNARVQKRAEDFTSRKGVVLSSYRAVDYDEDYAVQHSDGVICLGNQRAVETYLPFQKVIGINNAVFPVEWEGWRRKDFEAGRKHFLFFSGRGNVLKGLDLLLDAFVGTDLHLHICQDLEQDFASVYRTELSGCSNIHVHGFIRMRSSRFFNLARKCDWVILPTCAEGQPGGVVECMAHGMIPIISGEANISVGRWGIPLWDCGIDAVRSTALRASMMEQDWIRKMASKMVEETRDLYSVDNFRGDMLQAINQLVSSSNR